jgi:polysaccharide export outer membrane protein
MLRNNMAGIRFRALLAWLVLTLLGVSAIVPSLAQQPSSSATIRERDATQPGAKPGGVLVDEAFVIGADDVLGINVWKEAEVSRTVTVMPDGKISLPLVGELQAEGKTPKQLQEEIRSKLAAFIAEPEVTLIVQEIRSHRFNVLGQVQHPGSYVLTSSTTVLDAIALAGGFRDFAKQKAIYVVRSNPNGSQLRLQFNYREVVRGDKLKQNIKLENHDTVVVP